LLDFYLMSVSLVLPCYNPQPCWEHVIYSSYSSFSAHIHETVELVIVIDGKSDGATQKALSYIEENIPQYGLIEYANNKGKGYAIRQGVAVAKGDIILYTDIDFPYTTESMVKIYDALKMGDTDVAVGVKDDTYYSHVPFLRRIISRYLRFFIRIFLSMPITDTQCGLKGFKRDVAPLFLKTSINRYLFDLEFIRNCFKNGSYRVRAIPISLKENIHFRQMNYRILFSESMNFMRLLFKKPK
jgi:glycosyltransferase involved in cell wall biosynthesis